MLIRIHNRGPASFRCKTGLKSDRRLLSSPCVRSRIPAIDARPTAKELHPHPI